MSTTSPRSGRRLPAIVPARPVAHHPPAPRPLRPVSPPLPELLTVDEVAEILRTTRRAIYARIRRGSLPGVIRVARRVFIDQADLVDWLAKRRAVSLTTQGVQR